MATCARAHVGESAGVKVERPQRREDEENDLEAGASPRRMIQVVNGDSAPGLTIRGSRLGARRVWGQARLPACLRRG